MLGFNYARADLFKMERFIYDFVAQNTQYSRSTNKKPENHSILGPLLYGSSVCEGYAKAFKYLCDAAALPCIVVGGSSVGPKGNVERHSWNIVRVKNDYYQVDVTWDSIICAEDIENLEYYNLSDDEMKKDHTWNTRLLPRCDKTFTDTPFISGKNELKNLIYACLSQGRRCLSVRFKTHPSKESDIIRLVSKLIDQAPSQIRSKASGIEIRYNKTQNKAVIYFES